MQAHLTDAFGPVDMTEYFIHFVANQDPNRAETRVYWPRFHPETLYPSVQRLNNPLDVMAYTERLGGTRAIADLVRRVFFFFWQWS